MTPQREPLDIPQRGVLVVIAGIAGIGGLCVLVAWALVPGGITWPPATGVVGPSLETRPVADFEAFDKRQRAELAGAGDRIPIAQAMARIVARGADAFAPVENPP